jgi:hypothetical protein
MRQYDRLGAAVAGCNKQFERAAALDIALARAAALDIALARAAARIAHHFSVRGTL